MDTIFSSEGGFSSSRAPWKTKILNPGSASSVFLSRTAYSSLSIDSFLPEIPHSFGPEGSLTKESEALPSEDTMASTLVKSPAPSRTSTIEE